MMHSLHDGRVSDADVRAVLRPGLRDDRVQLHAAADADAAVVAVDGEGEVEVAHADVVARPARVDAAVRSPQDLERNGRWLRK